MSDAPSLRGEVEELDDWAELATAALTGVEQRVKSDERGASAATLDALTRSASADESSGPPQPPIARAVRSTPTSGSEGVTVSSARPARGYGVPTLNGRAGHVPVPSSNGLNNSTRRSVPLAQTPSAPNNNHTPSGHSGTNNGRPAPNNEVSSIVKTARPRRPLPRIPTHPNSAPRPGARAGISTLPYSAVDDTLFSPACIRRPPPATSFPELPRTATTSDGVSTKPWRGGDIVCTAKARLVTLPPRRSGSDAADLSLAAQHAEPGMVEPSAAEQSTAGISGPSTGTGVPNWRHWTESDANALPSARSDGSSSTVRPPRPAWSDPEPRARYSAPPARALTRPNGRGRNSAPPPSRSSGSRKPQPPSDTRARYSAPPPRAPPHNSPRRTRSTRQRPRPSAPAFRGTAALLEPLPPLPTLRYPRASRALVDAVQRGFPPLPPTPDVDSFQDPFQRLMSKHGSLLPHRPGSQMEALNLIFAAAADLPEEEGMAVAAMVMEAFGSVKAEQRKSVASQRSQSSRDRRESSERESLRGRQRGSLERRDSSERESLERKVEERARPDGPKASAEVTTDVYTLLLEQYAHLLSPNAVGSKEEILEALLGAAFELPDGQREPAVQSIMDVYEAVAAGPSGPTGGPAGASSTHTADPYDLLVMQYGHLVPAASRGNRVETLDALLLAATELSDGEGALVAQLVMDAHDASTGERRGSSTHRSSVDTRSVSLGEDPFQRLMAEYGHLLPHRPDTRMATLDLMFVAATALPEAEGEAVAALVSEAWEALNATLPALDQASAQAMAAADAADRDTHPEADAGDDGDDGDDEDDGHSRWSDDSERGPCPCGGACGAVCEYEAAIGPQPISRPQRRSFRPRRREEPTPSPQPEAGPSRPQRQKSSLRAARDLRFWDRPKFKPGPSGSQGLDMLHAFLERETAKAEARGEGGGKGKGREVPRVSFADERRRPEEEEEEEERVEERRRRTSVSSGSWDEAELAARGLVSEAEPEVALQEERRRWFRRR